MYKTLERAMQDAPADPQWRVSVAPGTAKNLIDAPQTLHDLLLDLRAELAEEGPFQSEWPRYGNAPVRSKGSEGEYTHHCYLRCAHKTYVVSWVTVGADICVSVA